MKKITFCIILMIISLKVQAQLTNGNFTDEVDYRLQNINKTPITSNILIDRVFPVAVIQVFNQGSRIDTSSYAHFKQAWSELNRASYSRNFSTLNQLKAQIKNKNYQESEIPIGIINTEFHQGNYGTTQENANVNFNSTTGLFTNKSGRNPFIKRQTTIISPLVTKASGSSISFRTDNLFKLHKYGKHIKTLQLSTNGSTFTLISNYTITTSSFTTSYSSSGTKDLRFTITYTDNTTKITHAKVDVEVPSNYLERSGVSEIEKIEADSDLAFQGYDENQAILGKNEYRIYYNDANNLLDKPIIIIDGFDPGDKRKIDPQSPDYNKDSQSVKELMTYDHDNDVDTPKKDLIDELNDLGYDVIIVNHLVNVSNGIDAGSDYIQRNAFTLISLIRDINETKQGNEPNVVIGPSMGGLISRYALAYMEKKLAETGNNTKWNHDTRLWVSFDSPHQGANIPIGVQKGLDFLGNTLGVEGAKNFIDQQLNKPATKQMLVNHYTNNTSLPVGAINFRDRFQNELNNLGMPENLRKVALINGSIMGSLNGVSSGKTLEVDADIDTFIFIPYLPVTSIVTTALSNIFADSLLSNFYHSTNKKTGSQKTFTFDGGLRGKFLWWEWWTTRTTFKSQPKAKGGYDIAPGGFFNAQRLVADQSVSQDGYVYVLINIGIGSGATVFDETHSFIPTKSALAYSSSTVLDEAIGTKDRVCTGETPFDSYFAPKENEEHIFLTSKNVAWLTKEIEGNEQAVSTYLPSNIRMVASAGSDDAICYNEYSRFSTSLGAKCVNKNISWSVSSNLKIVENNNANIRIGAKFSNSAGSGWVKATIAGTTLKADVEVGTPASSSMRFNRVESTNFQSNQWNILAIYYNGLLNISRYTWQWQVPSSAIRNSSPNHSYINFNPNVKRDTQIYIRARAANNCGYSDWYGKWFNIVKATNNCKDGTNSPCSDAQMDY
jgi:hypothetical protein